MLWEVAFNPENKRPEGGGMNDLIMSGGLILSCFGCLAVGYLWGCKKADYWRIQWIKMEHKLARLENREPRQINLHQVD